MKSKCTLKKTNMGPPYKLFEGEDITFITKVCKCQCPTGCDACHVLENRTWLQEETITVKLGDGYLHPFIEEQLLSNENLRRGSAMTFFLTADDAFGEVGVIDADGKFIIGPHECICCYLEEPAY